MNSLTKNTGAHVFCAVLIVLMLTIGFGGGIFLYYAFSYNIAPQAPASTAGQTQNVISTPPPTMTAPATTSSPVPLPNRDVPSFTYASASNTTAEGSGRNYSPDLVIDGRVDTAWNCPRTSGEWIRLSADATQYVAGIKILNGYTKYSPDYDDWLYYLNNRPKSITISFSDWTSIDATLNDTYTEGEYEYQDIPFSEIIETTYVMITINNVYSGDKWNDTCISEIQVY